MAKFLVLSSPIFIIQIVINNKYLGHFFVLGVYFFLLFAPQIGLEHYLLRFGKGMNLIYSDMNHFGHYWIRYSWFSIYWVLVSALLLVLGSRIWIRGKETDFKSRIKKILDFSQSQYRYAVIFILCLIAVSGMYIFYNINILNEFHSTKYYTKQQVHL